jgi:hypothetical protein
MFGGIAFVESTADKFSILNLDNRYNLRQGEEQFNNMPMQKAPVRGSAGLKDKPMLRLAVLRIKESI